MSQEIYILKADKEKLLGLIHKTTLQKFGSNVNLEALEVEINKAKVIALGLQSWVIV